eukprot:sb/3479228/
MVTMATMILLSLSSPSGVLLYALHRKCAQFRIQTASYPSVEELVLGQSGGNHGNGEDGNHGNGESGVVFLGEAAVTQEEGGNGTFSTFQTSITGM